MQDDLVIDPADGSIIAHRMLGGQAPAIVVLSTRIAGKIGVQPVR
jgi:hypothetical protein